MRILIIIATELLLHLEIDLSAVLRHWSLLEVGEVANTEGRRVIWTIRIPCRPLGSKCLSLLAAVLNIILLLFRVYLDE